MEWVGIGYTTDLPDDEIDGTIRSMIVLHDGDEVESGYFFPLNRRTFDVEFPDNESAERFADDFKRTFAESLSKGYAILWRENDPI